MDGRDKDEYRNEINPLKPKKQFTGTVSANPYALLQESDLAMRLGLLLTKVEPGLLKECALRLADYDFHIKRARRNAFVLGVSSVFFVAGLIFWGMEIFK